MNPCILHIKQPDHGIYSTSNQGLFITFPTFKTQTIIGQHDIYITAIPLNQPPSRESSVDDTPAVIVPSLSLLTRFQDSINQETEKIDNLLGDLRTYFNTVKTQRQLKLEVPAGFRQLTTTQHHALPKVPTKDSIPVLESVPDNCSSDYLRQLSADDATIITSNLSTKSISQVGLSEDFIPIMRCVDKPSPTLPNTIKVSEDYIRSTVGFHKIDTMKKHFQSLYQSTVHLDNTPPDAILDLGSYATLKKKARNTVPVPRSSKFADVFHMDIIFGPEAAIGNIHYGLLFTDRHSRMTYLYPLRNLTSDIPRQLQAFFAHLGIVPRRLISDFDLKLIGGKARD